jgi:hypothetical protein
MRRASSLIALIAPTFLTAMLVIANNGTDRVLAIAAPAVLGLWAAMMIVLSVRWIQAVRASRRTPEAPSSWGDLGVLTGAGRSLSWSSAGALTLAVITGWASASVLGVFGFACVYLATTWTAIVAGSDAPWRTAKIERTLLPEVPLEGDDVREHVRLVGIQIPAGMRLFVTGRALPGGATTRFTAGTEASGGELEVESELGPAPRGDHHAAPLSMWLGDVLGLARGPIVARGAASLTVLPRPSAIDGVRELLGAGRDAPTSAPVQRMPTEGTFRIREYAPGDDARRIHWVRSLQANQLVVRLPDEIPPAEPRVRVVVDNELGGAESLTCRGSDQLLDALVRIWLGIGKSIAETGARVTMVAAIDDGNGPVVFERPMNARTPREALRLGARVRWQGARRLSAMIERADVRHVLVTSRPRRVDTEHPLTWVVVPDAYWTTLEPEWRDGNPSILPYPIGSGDNRMSRRKAEQLRLAMMRRDRAVLTDMLWTERSVPAGVYVASPHNDRVALKVAS